MKLWQRVLIGLVCGVLAGAGLGERAAVFQPLGTIFINLILMVVIPLIFMVLVNGITGLQSSQNIRRVGIKSILAFLCTACFAVVLGLVVTAWLQPGIGANLALEPASMVDLQRQPLSDTLMGLVPSNALKSLVEGNILHVIVFAFFTGFTLNSLSPRCPHILAIFREGAQVMLKMIESIIKLAPFGVFGYMSWVVGTQGVEVLWSLGKLIGTIILACALQYIVFGVIIMVVARLSPLPFYRKMMEAQLIAFATSSSKAAMMPLMRIAERGLGISKNNTQFLIPLSSALNMDGGAIYLGSCVLFFAQATGVTFTPQDYLVIILTCTLGSIGAAGIPSGILLFLGMALTSVGLPIEAVAVIAGIDRILDMITTAINITGDACISLVIDKTEGTLDEATYNRPFATQAEKETILDAELT